MLSDFLDVFFLLNQLKFCMWPLIHEKNIALHFFFARFCFNLARKNICKKTVGNLYVFFVRISNNRNSSIKFFFELLLIINN